jgi:GDP-D-mannose 3',5'-epimerase
MKQKRAIVFGAGGFIGGHLVTRLKLEGYRVLGVDLKTHEYPHTIYADDFFIKDLTDPWTLTEIIKNWPCDDLYQLAADMGGAPYIFSGQNDANVMLNSAGININTINSVAGLLVGSRPRIFYSSSACIYPAYNQLDPLNPNCKEDSAYPAAPDSEYGWEKLFSERLYLAASRNYGLDVRIARFHNIFGPFGTWCGGKEKAPAAICRKIAQAETGDTIDIIGDGEQTRSFLYVDECVEGIRRLMESNFPGPVNIGSEEMISINQLVAVVSQIAGKRVILNHIDGPQGVRGRNSDNTLLKQKLCWAPSQPLTSGLTKTYKWIEKQTKHNT